MMAYTKHFWLIKFEMIRIHRPETQPQGKRRKTSSHNVTDLVDLTYLPSDSDDDSENEPFSTTGNERHKPTRKYSTTPETIDLSNLPSDSDDDSEIEVYSIRSKEPATAKRTAKNCTTQEESSTDSEVAKVTPEEGKAPMARMESTDGGTRINFDDTETEHIDGTSKKSQATTTNSNQEEIKSIGRPKEPMPTKGEKKGELKTN